jgi:hypothetical protein
MARIYQDNVDSLSIAENLAEASTLGVSDDIVLQDTLESKVVYKLSIADNISMAESLVGEYGFLLALTDAISITESLVEVPFLGWIGADTLAITESLVSVATFHLGSLDNIVIVENRGMLSGKKIVDDITITESVQEIPELWYTMVRCGASCCHAGL